ncbi:MAG: carbohydrate binding family 9 domain-containing protein [Gammaproteobacteria bacterium]|nr:carbohydrate binding family 9 domain-containing protein [Gammaproteobacteria bacterium]MDH3416260.1 carbohydrate binding family 9 domain-containing protein [Gammaproteobacteria bacterium]
MSPGLVACRSILVSACLAATAAAIAQVPTDAPVVQAAEMTSTPVLDGRVLGDSAWTGLSPTSGFWQVQPDDGEPATQKTEVYVGFSDDALYIGVIAYDDDPDAILVTDSRRDSGLGDTDSFQVVIDGLRDGQNGFVFGTNPAGIEYDGQVTREGTGGAFASGSGGFNLNWDGTWDVATDISGAGWSAEMRIPFRTLRYGRGETQTWGINFQRNIRRNNEISYWAPLSRQHNLYRVSEAGSVTGITPPAQKNLKISPYVLGSSSRGGELAGSENNNELGFDIKYSITPSLTLDATYNTDFAQVEADERKVNLDRFSLFFPEKRPFFLENAGQFAVGDAEAAEMFFSRRIGISDEGDQLPIEGGVRVSGKIGNSTNVGFLHMSSEAVAGVAPGNKFTVARLNHELPGRSAIGLIFVNRDGDGSHLVAPGMDENQTYAIDGRWGIGENLSLSAWAATTSTPGLNGRDEAFTAKAIYDSAKWAYRLEYGQVGEDFNPEVGFLSRSDFRRYRAFLMRRIRPDDKWGLLEIRPHASYTVYRDFDGFQETGFSHNDIHWEFRNGYEVHTGINLTHEGVKDAFDIIDGVTIEPGTYEHSEVDLVFHTNQAAPISLELHTTVGGRFGGDRVSLEPTLRYRIGETFSSELSYNYNEFDLPVDGGKFEANLVRLRLSYSFTPKILLQALVQYNELDDILGTNLRFSWLQSANSGLFLVYNEIDERGIGGLPAGREFIVKYSYIFDVFN